MGSFRHRVKGKGKRWKKGHSSSSNPETKTHRDMAKSRFFQENLGQGGLTAEALKKLDALTTKIDTPSTASEYQDDDGTLGGTFKTFQTFASDWSNCSNQSFSRLLNNFRQDSALHKEMLAILAAVTEVIKSYNGRESSVEYFAALMSTLEKSETENSVAAVLSLLGMGIKGVPHNILKAKFSQTSKLLVDFLGKYADSDNNIILRSLIGCMSVILRAQDAAVWSYPSTLQVFDSILAFTTHSKPKVRKAAQHAVCAILRGSDIMIADDVPHPDHHPAAKHTAKFCITQVETSGSLGGTTTTLHILNLLKEILFTFPKTQLKTTCETILKVMTLGDTRVTSCGLQALHGLFVSRPPVTVLSSELNAQLVAALYDYQPSASDVGPTLAWLLVMQEAFVNLAKMDVQLCWLHVPRFFTVATQLWMSERPEVRAGTTYAMQAVAQESFSDQATAPEVRDAAFAKAVNTVQAGLSYQFHDAWPHVMHLLGIFYEVSSKRNLNVLLPSLKMLGDLRDAHQFSFARELEYAVGKAIRFLGARAVISAIPLEITGEEKSYEFRRSWMLPVLRDNVQRSELKYFVQFFLPLASKCRDRSAYCGKQGDSIGAHSYDLLQSQIWALLPGFCTDPVDVKESFKGVAKILGIAISERKELRISTMAALRKLISSSKSADDKQDIAELARFAKNFLPILFNLYSTKPVGSDEEGQRLSAYETIKVYLEIADSQLCSDLFDRALIKMESEDNKFIKYSVLDLLRALLPYQNVERLGKLYHHCKEMVPQLKDSHQQKKSYRLLEQLCSCDSESCEEFLNENLADLKETLIQSLSKSAPSSKGPRLRCLIFLVRRLKEPDDELIQQVIPEAVLCCKDINERCRTAAYALLVEVGNAMLRWSQKSDSDVLRDYVGLLMVGLAGQPRMASASILALTRVTYHFRASLPLDLVQQILDNVCLLVTSSTREIVDTCLSYIKMFITSFPFTVTASAVSLIVKSFVGMTDDCKRHFRLKTRNILDRFIRKFGFDTIKNMVPQSDLIMHKRLKNIRKMQEKKKRDKEQSKDGSSDDDNDDDEFKIRGQPKSIEEILAESGDSDIDDGESVKSKVMSKKKKQRATWIREDEDSFIDFTDSSASKRITATNPDSMLAKEVKKKKSSDFKFASDGRLIITDNSDDDNDDDGEATSRRFKKMHLMIDSDSGEEEMDTKSVTASSVGPIAGRKRRLSMSTVTQSEPAVKYKAGGTGIHRPIKKPVHKSKGKNVPSATLGTEYRARKAKGDVKKKGRPDPYAYVPLSRKFLNKRKRAKHSGQFASVVRGAKKGAIKGSRAKTKGLKKKTQRKV